MQVFGTLEEYRAAGPVRDAVVSVGNFDGVHRAHQAVLAKVRAEAAAAGLASVAVSFEPHPSRVLRPEKAPRLITPGAEKVRRLAQTGLDCTLLLPFTRELSQLTPRQFVADVLVDGLRTRSIHEGRDFRFGHRQAGTMASLQEWGREFGFAVHEQPQLVVGGEAVSSSGVRRWVELGNLARARYLLGRSFSVRGKLARGRGIGTRQTVPTLNLEPYRELLPARGVYISRVQMIDATSGTWWDALTNVGERPTFGPGGGVTVETYLLQPPPGFAPEVNQEFEVAFLRRLRDERRFDTAEALREQIHRDIGQAQRYFSRLRHLAAGLR